VNLDDGYGKRLAALAGEDAVTFGLDENAMVRAADMEYSGWETRFTLVSPEGWGDAVIHLPGRCDLHNSLAAAAAALALGVPTGAILSGLASAKGVPGRFEPVEVDTPFRVIIDYAHNEDGLRRALKTASRITSGRLITVFGCPGERDREKRPRMGKVAGSISDISILTTDDCYGEDPESILDEVEAGLSSSGGAYRRQEDRRLAIETALSMAAPDDTVLIAGKGHERFQRMKDGPHPFSDRTVVLESVGGKGS
jgi:UDP-N-acetylmuramoyl-L-alanyl-D-glutamate--2,6-diaminopimelate ligase